MRECIFCGSAASTKEHAWPNWLIQQFPAGSGAEIEGQRGAEPVLRWKSKGHSQQVRNVCAQCNNGWMSALEGEAKEIIEPLLGVSRYDLSVSARRTLTRWAMKTAMVFESLGHQRQPYYTQAERDAIRLGESPLGKNSVWAGRCVEFNGFYAKASDLFDNPDSSLQRARGYVTTLGLGSVALQVLSVRPTQESAAPTRITISPRDGPWNFVGDEIWPREGTVIWAPTQALLGEVGLEALARRFRTTPA
jgi:hypothetical protein